jgi:hypothetical protein
MINIRILMIIINMHRIAERYQVRQYAVDPIWYVGVVKAPDCRRGYSDERKLKNGCEATEFVAIFAL